VNFLGPNDELVVSGSDDGNFFIWDKSTANLTGIYEGDGTVVNVIEGHPSLPLLAVSGIDTTVKVHHFTLSTGSFLLTGSYHTQLFAPSRCQSLFSRIDNVDQILESNGRPVQSFDFRVLIAEAMLRTGSSTTNECIHQ
jgi:WD repeat-containing protein 42A